MMQSLIAELPLVCSILANAAIIQSSLGTVINQWRSGEIDNFTFIEFLHRTAS